MHCPRCGTSAAGGRPYCRNCGMGLERIAEFLGQATAFRETPEGEIARLKELKSKHENWGNRAGAITGCLFLLVILEILFTPIILKGGILPLLGALLLLVAIGAGAMAYFQISARSLRDKIARPALPPSPPLSLPELNMRAPESITDRTTELLAEDKRRPTGEIA